MQKIALLTLVVMLTGCFEITTDVGYGGSIHPTSKYVKEGDTAVFTITPESGYTIASADGCAGVLTNNSYKTGLIQDNCNIAVQFTEAVPLNVDIGSDRAVDAGSEVFVAGSINLDTSYISHWQWTQIAGEPIELTSQDLSGATFLAPEGGEVGLRLTVTTKTGFSISDEILISVKRQTNQVPVADAGFDQSVDAGEEVYIGGANSYDVDGQIISYYWTQVSGVPVTIENQDQLTAKFVAQNDTQGTLVFELTVTDDANNQASDKTSVIVGNVSEAPGAPVFTSASSLDPKIAEFSWLAAASQLPPEDIIYTVHISQDQFFLPHGGTARLQLKGAYSAKLNTLTPNTRYYAKIEAHSVGSRSSWSNELSFTTASSAPLLQNTVEYQILDTTTQGISVDEISLKWDSGQGITTPKVGDILINEDQAVPFLRAVQSVSVNGSLVSVDTIPTSLAEVFKEFSFSASMILPPENNVSVTPPQNSSNVASNKDDKNDGEEKSEFSQLKSVTITDSENDQAVSKVAAQAIGSDEQVAKDGPLELHSIKTIVARPGERVRINVSAVVTDQLAIPEYSIEALELLSVVSPEGLANVTQGTGLGQYVIISDFSDNDQYRQKKQFNWVPGKHQVDLENADPYLLVFHAIATKSGCGTFELGCRRSVDLTVPVYLLFDEPTPENVTFSTSGTASLSGNIGIDFSPTVTANANIADGRLEAAGVTMYGKAKFTLDTLLNASASASAYGGKDLFRRRFAQVYMGGPIPIVVVTTAVLRAEFDATTNANVDIEQNYNYTVNMSAGVAYDRISGWSPIKHSESSYQFTVKGEAEGAAAMTVKLIPDIKVAFYGTAMGHMKLEPYIFGETTLNGRVIFEQDSTTADWDAMYRFEKLDVGGGVDLAVRADFSILDYVVAGWPSRDTNDFNEYQLIPKSVVYGLPKLELEKEECGLKATISDSTITKANGFVFDSSLWRAFPNDDPNYTIRLLPDEWAGNPDSGSQSALVCVDAEREYYETFLHDYNFDVRIAGHTKVGSWLQMYAELKDIQLPRCPQGENSSVEDMACSSIYVAEYDSRSGSYTVREYDQEGAFMENKGTYSPWLMYNFGIIDDAIHYLKGEGIYRERSLFTEFTGIADNLSVDDKQIYVARAPSNDAQTIDVIAFDSNASYIGIHRTLNYWYVISFDMYKEIECYTGYLYGYDQSNNIRLYVNGQLVHDEMKYYSSGCAVDSRWAYFMVYPDGDTTLLTVVDHSGNVKQELSLPGGQRVETDGKLVAVTDHHSKKVYVFQWQIDKDAQGNILEEQLMFRRSFDTTGNATGVLIQ